MHVPACDCHVLLFLSSFLFSVLSLDRLSLGRTAQHSAWSCFVLRREVAE